MVVVDQVLVSICVGHISSAFVNWFWLLDLVLFFQIGYMMVVDQLNSGGSSAFVNWTCG